MLLAVLYDADDAIAAAAPACDFEPFGHRYWIEIHGRMLAPWTPACHTAVVDMCDPYGAARLLAMDFADGQEAAEFLDARLFDSGCHIAERHRSEAGRSEPR